MDQDRRKFFGDAAGFAALSFLPAEALAGQQMTQQQREAVAGGAAWEKFKDALKVVEYNAVDLPDGQEIATTMELNLGGVTRQFRSYMRRVDAGATYSVFHSMISNGKLHASIVNGTKGAVEGDYRHDTVQITRLEPDGSAVRQQASVVPVLASNPYAGLNPQQTVDQFVQDKAEGRIE
jgi:hypothetical protein